MSDPVFELTTSRGFVAWLSGLGGSLAFSTYQAGKVFLIGIRPDGTVAVFERSFARAMGLAVGADGQSLYVATQLQIMRFDNILPAGQMHGAHDAVFAPHAAWTTGDVDVHDMALGPDGRPIFVNTLFNCLACVEDGHSFAPMWQPPFISRLVPEDRCHLNGMATQEGRPRFVTALAKSDVVDGWRDYRASGGVLVDVASGAVLADGMSMPHSPRLHKGRLWLLNSGTGAFGWVDLKSGRFEPVAFCPGYARGMAIVGDYAVIGLSRPRKNRTLQGLPLDDALAKHGAEPRTGLIAVDLNTGAATDWLRIDGVVAELFDVAFVPRIRNPALIGLKGDEIKRVISIGDWRGL
jgi:uncharacterized protein (TIGR03032 family)